MKRARGNLSRQVDAWTQQTIRSARFLLGLYRRLQDDKQAARALEVLKPCEERNARSGHLVPGDFGGLEAKDEIAAEGQAWENLLEAQIGFCCFFATIGASCGVKHVAERAYRAAVRGMETAFPEEWAVPRRRDILLRISTLYADLVIEDLEGEGSPEAQAELRESIEVGIRKGFTLADRRAGDALVSSGLKPGPLAHALDGMDG